jgi:zinc/manganese transport system permease protein
MESMTLYGLALGPFAEFGFMRRALVGCLVLALSCGPIGTILVIRRMSLMGDALSHAVLPCGRPLRGVVVRGGDPADAVA